MFSRPVKMIFFFYAIWSIVANILWLRLIRVLICLCVGSGAWMDSSSGWKEVRLASALDWCPTEVDTLLSAADSEHYYPIQLIRSITLRLLLIRSIILRLQLIWSIILWLQLIRSIILRLQLIRNRSECWISRQRRGFYLAHSVSFFF